MPDLLCVTYAQKGTSITSDALGMREMQARAYAKRLDQYLLIKSPPASGKSRALMFLALDKVHNQGLDKVIIAVPEMSIGASFKDTDLVSHGFFANWHIEARYNLCTPGSDIGKVGRVQEFLQEHGSHYLLCTHATLRFAWEKLRAGGDLKCLDKALLAIDEFHHASEEDGNKLGAMVDDVMKRSTAHIVAMTGSYFRGDAVPILAPEAENKFTTVTYTYYEQLNGYEYLKSLGLGYHFYRGQYLDALKDVLDLTKKTIIHIPSVNSRESTKRKSSELDKILDIIGTIESRDSSAGILSLRTEDGRLLKVADLVNDVPERVNILNYLRNIKRRDDMDIIIALGMAKEGFDWPWCEHVLTIGYRASLTEVVQIIGRATRDCEGKSHAQFTNLIAQPDAEDKDVQTAVNNLLKAISLSLLMKDVLAPNIRFRPRSDLQPGEKVTPDTLVVDDSAQPFTPELKNVIANNGIETVTEKLLSAPTRNQGLKEAIVNDDQRMLFATGILDVIRQVFPHLAPDEQQQLQQLVLMKLGLTFQSQEGTTGTEEGEGGNDGGDAANGGDSGTRPTPSIRVVDHTGGGKEPGEPAGNALLVVGDRFLNVTELNIDLISQINPFHQAFEILSKNMDAPTLRAIQSAVQETRNPVTEKEALELWPEIQKFARENQRPPSESSSDAFEQRLADALTYLRKRKAQKMREE